VRRTFDRLFGRRNDDFHDFPQVLACLKTTWIDKYKEWFVACWTDIIMHLENTTSNRDGSAHAKLKRYLYSSLENFDISWAKIHALLELQHTEIKASFEKSINIVLHNFKPSQFNLLRGFVPISALKKIVEESRIINTVGVDTQASKCLLRKPHGLPYAHELVEHARANMPIPLDCIDVYWTKLYMFLPALINPKVADDLDSRLAEELDVINQHFSVSKN